MTCEELRDDYELYALGTLEGEERDEISRHLARGCDNCTEGVRRASLVNAWIATSAPEVAPPARLRRRVREIAGVERPRYASWHWAWAALCAALIAIAVYLGSEVRRSSAELADARKQLRETVAESAAGRQLLELLNAPETNYLFFVAKPDLRGYSNFAATYPEHLAFAKAYQQALDSLYINKTAH